MKNAPVVVNTGQSLKMGCRRYIDCRGVVMTGFFRCQILVLLLIQLNNKSSSFQLHWTILMWPSERPVTTNSTHGCIDFQQQHMESILLPVDTNKLQAQYRTTPLIENLWCLIIFILCYIFLLPIYLMMFQQRSHHRLKLSYIHGKMQINIEVRSPAFVSNHN